MQHHGVKIQNPTQVSERALLLKAQNVKLNNLKSTKEVARPQVDLPSIENMNNRDILRKVSSKKILASLRKILAYSNAVKVENDTILVDFKLIPDYASFKERLE